MLVIGTGAVASFLIPRLARAGEELQIFGGASPRLHALGALAPAVSEPAQVHNHESWLVCCKTWQNQAKVEALAAAPAPRRILVLQNGLEPESAWRVLAPTERGLSTYGVASTGPGQVVGGGAGEIVVPRASAFAPLLRAANLDVVEQDDMQAAIWSKLVVNASLNVVASLGDWKNGQVLEYTPARALARQAAVEVAELGRRLGLEPAGDPVQIMERVAALTADNVCSTLVDLRAGRPTEYESINGALLRLAHLHGVRLPMLEELDREFHRLQADSRPLRAVS